MFSQFDGIRVMGFFGSVSSICWELKFLCNGNLVSDICCLCCFSSELIAVSEYEVCQIGCRTVIF